MATLNGWQRLWVVVSGLWAVLWVVVGLAEDGLFLALVIGVVPPVLLYAAGLGVAWIRRGFQQRKA